MNSIVEYKTEPNLHCISVAIVIVYSGNTQYVHYFIYTMLQIMAEHRSGNSPDTTRAKLHTGSSTPGDNACRS